MLPKLFFLVCSIFTTHSYNTQCLHHQKTLLLQLKKELIFNSNFSTKLVQWNQSDECCKWYGVQCDADGYVVSLELDQEYIYGGIGDSSSLFRLKYLEKLNLALNQFNSTRIPKGIHSLTYLTHLDLSNAGFGGQVPLELSFLRRLVSLNISNIWTQETLCLKYPNLEMIVQNLTGLRELYLDRINITSSYERRNWSHIISSYLPNLTTLSMVDCHLYGTLSKPFWQLHSLSILRLDRNDLSTVAVDLFANFPCLTTLSLSECYLEGSFPNVIFQIPTLFGLPSLLELDLSNNHFMGQVEEFHIVNVSNNVTLDLSGNRLEGPIPDSLFQLKSLESLSLSENLFNGTFQLDKIHRLANLTLLDLSNNNLSINSSTYGFPLLKDLRLASCNMYEFPDFIKHSDMLENLELSNNRITGEIPSWIWAKKVACLDLSFNLLTDLQKPCNISASLLYLDLRSNQLRGKLNLLISPNIRSHLWFLLLSNNSFSGPIPISLCNATHLRILDLSVNTLSGSIPSCLLQDTTSLQVLDLHNNTLEGKIPKSLQSCRFLEFMNVGNNMIKDTFPCMLSSSLRVLVMHSNKFHGEVRCHNNWPELQILDISSNHFSGSLESINFSSWSGMVLGSDVQLKHDVSSYYSWASSGMTLIIKVLDMQFEKIWPDFNVIDFSCNNFKGAIPNAIGDLTSLHVLNFSHNALNGSIPKSFGQLSNLESLDLSRNQLSGAIPMELAGLTFLEVLNLSHNKLVGMIPNGHQFQTFSGDSFEGNLGLCGFPLNISCSGIDDSDISPSEDDNEQEKGEIEWEYVCAALGYVVGLGIIFWLLLFCRSFREKYFGKIEEIVEDIFIARDMRRRRARRAVRNQVRRK